MSLYREMNARQLEIEYSPSSMIGGEYLPFIERYVRDSAAARRSLNVTSNIAYGSKAGQVLDLYHRAGARPGSSGPLHLFIHGGYWQELSHRESAPMACSLASRGISLAVINYTLSPMARIEDMVKECHQCLVYLVSNCAGLGIDPGNLSISGHSAGAHLLMQMLHHYQGDTSVKGVRLAIPMCGIYDLTPLQFTSINQPLELDQKRAVALSPLFQSSQISQSVLVVIAEKDTAEFRRQATEYHQKLVTDKTPCRLLQCAGVNHFDIILELEAAARPILDAVQHAHCARSKPVS